MQNSIFVRFIILCYDKLNRYYHYSSTCSFLKAVNDFFKQAAQGSKIITFLTRDMKEQKWWTNSYSYQGICAPFRLIKKISSNGEGVLVHWVRESGIIRAVLYSLNNLQEFNTRIAGWMILAFAFTQMVLIMLQDVNNITRLFWRILLALVALFLIQLNKPLKSLHEGSRITQWLSSLLKD